MTNTRRSPKSRNPPRYRLTLLTLGSRASACPYMFGKGVVASVVAPPAGVTQRSVPRLSSVAERLSPACKLLLAPSTATLPNTAIAPVAAIASERARVALDLNSISAIRDETPMIGRCSLSITTIAPLNAAGRISSNASVRLAKATSAMPIVVMPLMRIVVVKTTHARPPRNTTTEPICGADFAPLAPTVRYTKISFRNGITTPTTAANRPPTVAIATLCQLTMCIEPTGNAKDR